jgi:hypothetical protein
MWPSSGMTLLICAVARAPRVFDEIQRHLCRVHGGEAGKNSPPNLAAKATAFPASCRSRECAARAMLRNGIIQQQGDI